MSKEILIKKLKKKNPSLKNPEVSKILDIFCESIKKALRKNKRVELRGFGTFFVKNIREKYSARNPKTGELIYVPEKNKVRFKISKKLYSKING